MSAPLPLKAFPCPRCGSRRLVVESYETAVFAQEVEVADDGRVFPVEPAELVEWLDADDWELSCPSCGWREDDEEDEP